MSSLLEFEDLALLDGGDLRAVLAQVPPDRMVQALAGAPASLRRTLLGRLAPAQAESIAARLAEGEPVPFEAVVAAQGEVLEALRRLSRGGVIAFDDPADMVA